MADQNMKLSEQYRWLVQGGGGAPQSTTATTAMGSSNWIDMKDVERAICIVWRVKGTGNITANTGVYGSTASSGSSPVAVSTLGLTTAITGVLTAARGTILLPNSGHIVYDISRDDLARSGENLRYVTVRARKKTRADRISAVWCLQMKQAKASNMATGNKASALTNS